MKPHSNSVSSAPWADQHRQAFEQALRQAVGTSQAGLRRQAIELMALHLIHPRQLIDSPLLSAEHPWRVEALAISDAFEAVSNGMEEPGVLEALDHLASDSLLQPWRHLILALHFFYEDLDEAVVHHLDLIPQTVPAGNLARLLKTLTGPSDARPLGSTLARLAQQVCQPDPFVLQSVQDVAEGLETDQEGLFWSGLIDWIEIVALQHPERAQAAVLWAWNQLEWRDFDEAVLLDLATSLWGRTESYRLAAVGTLPWDPEGSALLWLRFLVGAAREAALDEVSLRQARGLLDRFHRAALEVAPLPDDWTRTWNRLSLSWNSEASARGWQELLLAAEAPSPTPEPGQAAVSPNGQLDLFSW